MRLNLAKLKEWRGTVGTAGTMGTFHPCAGSSVPSPYQQSGTVGTEEGGVQGFVPSSSQTTGTRAASVYAGVPAVPSVPTENSNIAPVPLHDPAAWAEDFQRWVAEHCVFRDRCFGGVSCLHGHFCEWATTASVPCTRQTFEALLRKEDFETAEGLVYGLTLADDLKPSIPLAKAIASAATVRKKGKELMP
jgi:hypothetical protein